MDLFRGKDPLIKRKELSALLSINSKKLNYLTQHPQQLSGECLLKIDYLLNVKEDTTFDLVATQISFYAEKHRLRWYYSFGDKHGYLVARRRKSRWR